MKTATLSSQVSLDPVAVNSSAQRGIDRFFWWVAIFFVAEILLAVSTRMTRSWQWLALLLLVLMGLICTALIVRARNTLQLRTTTVIIIALLTRLPALFAAPLLDDDYFRFLWDGQQLAAGLSPYASAPSQHFLRGDLSSAWSAVLSEINHPDVPTIYGPSLQAVFALAVALSNADPWALKLLFIIADLALVIVLLQAGGARWLVLLYVVNPLVVKEISFSLHPDGLIAMAMTTAMLLLARLRPFLAGMCFAVVICAKLPLLLLAATLDLKNAAHRRAMLFCALIAVIAYLPFLFPDPMQPFAGLRAFADLWRVNALGYLAIEGIAGTYSRTLLTGFYVVCAIVAAYCVAHKKVPTATATVSYLALILFTAPTVNPWYWLPLLPLAVIAQRQDGALLLTPWLGSFALLLGYANGSTLADFGIATTLGEFSVFPVATVAQWLLMTAGFAYDLRRCLRNSTLYGAVRIPMPLSNALIRCRFPSVKQIPAQHVLDTATSAQPSLWIDIRSAYCPLDLAGRARSVTSLGEAQVLAAAFQQQHERGRVFISCAVGYASSEMALQLTGAGIDNVGNIEGGRRALARLQSAKAL